MSLSTPVAIVVFNRPQATQRVFRTVAEAKPRKLLIVADGPRGPADRDLCEETRRIVERIDWDCELLRNYSDVNLGCGRRVSSGFSWVFSQVEEAILLEDDTLPHPSFFRYCDELLSRYRHDERVMHVSGNNFQFGRKRTVYSYYFSKYTHIWGFATWRRAWRHYDFEMTRWPEFRATRLLESICDDPVERKHFGELFDRTHANPSAHNAYSTQWLFACWSQGGVTVLPSVNLVSNIGFGAQATHTRGDADWANLPVEDIGPLEHPPFVVCDRQADLYTFDRVFYGRSLRQSWLRRELARRTPAVLRRLYRRLYPREG